MNFPKKFLLHRNFGTREVHKDLDINYPYVYEYEIYVQASSYRTWIPMKLCCTLLFINNKFTQ